MDISRRGFLKVTGASLTVLMADLGFDLSPVEAQIQDFKIKSAQATPTICPYCSCGCGILVYAENGKLITAEGDPDHPINQGALCSKGSAVSQVYTSEKRLKKPLYRAPGSTQWEEKDWDWMIEKIAEKVKATRDANFITKETVTDAATGQRTDITVNRLEAIASIGGAALDNEEGYLLVKLMRALGLVYIEHQARI